MPNDKTTDSTKGPERKKRASQGPRPVFLVYSVSVTEEGSAELTVHASTRKAEKAMAALETNVGAKSKVLSVD